MISGFKFGGFLIVAREYYPMLLTVPSVILFFTLAFVFVDMETAVWFFQGGLGLIAFAFVIIMLLTQLLVVKEGDD